MSTGSFPIIHLIMGAAFVHTHVPSTLWNTAPATKCGDTTRSSLPTTIRYSWNTERGAHFHQERFVIQPCVPASTPPFHPGTRGLQLEQSGLGAKAPCKGDCQCTIYFQDSVPLIPILPRHFFVFEHNFFTTQRCLHSFFHKRCNC